MGGGAYGEDGVDLEERGRVGPLLERPQAVAALAAAAVPAPAPPHPTNTTMVRMDGWMAERTDGWVLLAVRGCGTYLSVQTTNCPNVSASEFRYFSACCHHTGKDPHGTHQGRSLYACDGPKVSLLLPAYF